MAGVWWQDKETTILRDMIEKGASIDELCEVFTCRSKSSIRQKAEELGLTLKTLLDINIDAYERFLKSREVDMNQFKQHMKAVK